MPNLNRYRFTVKEKDSGKTILTGIQFGKSSAQVKKQLEASYPKNKFTCTVKKLK